MGAEPQHERNSVDALVARTVLGACDPDRRQEFPGQSDPRLERLNRAGLHLWRKRLAHALAEPPPGAAGARPAGRLRDRFRPRRLCPCPRFPRPRRVSPAPGRTARLRTRFAREHQQGDTITRRVAVGPELLRPLSSADALLGLAALARDHGLCRSDPQRRRSTISRPIAGGSIKPARPAGPAPFGHLPPVAQGVAVPDRRRR